MKNLKKFVYESPLTLEEFLQFSQNEKFVISREYEDYDAAYYNADPDTGFFASRLKSTKKGYFLSKPNFLNEFEFLINYYIKKKKEEKAEIIVKIFNKYVNLKFIESPEIKHQKEGSGRDYYRDTFNFVYGEPKKENFDVYNLTDCRPDFVRNFMDDLLDIAFEYAEAEKLKNQATQKRQAAISKEKLLKKKLDKASEEEKNQLVL